MHQTRRNFFKTLSAALSGTLVYPAISFGTEMELPLKIGVCTRITNSEILSQYGYSYIEEGVQTFLVPQKSEDEFNELLALAKTSRLPVIACNVFIPGSLKSVGPDANHPGILEYAETAFRRAEIAGVKTIVFGSGGSRRIPDGFAKEKAREQFTELCSQMAPIAAKYNVVVVLEPLNSTECNFINLVSEGGEMVRKIDHPNFRLLADIYHMKMENEGPESILEYGNLIKHLHIAEKQERAAPGTYREDFMPYFKALKQINYQGCMSVECRWRNLEEEASSVVEYLKEILNAS